MSEKSQAVKRKADEITDAFENNHEIVDKRIAVNNQNEIDVDNIFKITVQLAEIAKSDEAALARSVPYSVTFITKAATLECRLLYMCLSVVK